MAKAKTKRAPRKRQRAEPEPSGGAYQLFVTYGNLNVGDVTCRLALSVRRSQIAIATADRILCGKRLTGTILARAAGGAGQESLPGLDDDRTLSGVFDVKGFGVTKKAVTFGLTFAIESIDVSEIAHFAKREGLLTVEHVEDLPDEPKARPDGDGDGEDLDRE